MRTLKNELIEKGISKDLVPKNEEQDIETNKYPKETLSQREWKEIMGYNRDTYSRAKGGAIRRRR